MKVIILNWKLTLNDGVDCASRMAYNIEQRFGRRVLVPWPKLILNSSGTRGTSNRSAGVWGEIIEAEVHGSQVDYKVSISHICQGGVGEVKEIFGLNKWLWMISRLVREGIFLILYELVVSKEWKEGVGGKDWRPMGSSPPKKRRRYIQLQ